MRLHRITVALAVAGWSVLCGAAEMPLAERKLTLHIASQPVGEALNELARQSGLQVAVYSAIGDGITSPDVSGDLSARDALARLLEGTGLEFEFARDNVVIVRRRGDAAATAPGAAWHLAQATPDGESQSVAAADAGEEGIQSIVITGSALWMGKTGGTQKEVPQSVTVIDRQRIEDQHIQTLTDALDATTGITLQRASSLFANFYSRGFNITNLQLDGGASLDRSIGYGNALPDMVQFERVEVLRGADGLFSGAGEPGGRVNLVRKRPTSTPQAMVNASAGRWNTYQGQLDVSGPVAFDGRLKARGVASYTNQGSFFDTARDGRKTLAYGILEADVTERTTLTAGASYEDQELPYFAYGLPRFSSGGDLGLPRSAYLTPEWSYYDTHIKSAFLGLEQGFGSRWVLKADAHYLEQHEERAGLNYFSAINPVTHLGPSALPSRQFGDITQKSVDVSLSGPLTLFGRGHQLVLGASWQDVGIASVSQSGSGEPYDMGDVFSFDPASYPKPEAYLPPAYSYVPGITQSGVYAMLRLHVAEPLHVMLGGRYSRYEFESVFTSIADGAASVTRYEDSGVFTPYGGLVYDLNPHWNLYASIGETYTSQAGSLKGPPPGTPLKPISGRNYEIGGKGDLAGGAMTAAVALYRIEREGEAVEDFRYPYSPGQLGASCCYLDDGDVVSQGVDAEVSTERFHGVTLTAGYTYNDNQDKLAGSGRYHSRTPRHLFKAFGVYDVAGTSGKLRLGGGVTVQTDNYVSGTAFSFDADGNVVGDPVAYEFRQGGYSLWNAFAEYRVSDAVTAALNVSNLFDKTYYATVGTSGYGNWYGEPRNVTFTLRAKF